MLRRAIFAATLMAGLAAAAFAQAPPPVPALPDTIRQTIYNITSSTCGCAVGFQLYGDQTDVDNWVQVFVNGQARLSTDPVFGWSLSSPTGPLSSIPRPITDAILTFASAQTATVAIVGAQRPRRLQTFSENQPITARQFNQIFNTVFAELRELWDRQVVQTHVYSFYFAAAGSDLNDCATPMTACQTLARLNNLSQSAGTIMHLNGGDTFTGGITVNTNNLTITNYGTGNPTISSGTSVACINATNFGGLVVSNITCLGGGNALNTNDGIVNFINIGNLSVVGPSISNVTVSGYGGNCIDVNVTGPVSTSKFIGSTSLTGSTIHDCTGNVNGGIFGPGFGLNACVRMLHGNLPVVFDQITISHNIIYNCPGAPGTTYGTGFGVWVTDVKNCTFSNNIVHDTGSANTTSPGPAGVIFLRVTGNPGCTVSFNEVYNISGGSAGDGEGIDFDIGVVNSLAEYNYVHETQTGGLAIFATFYAQNGPNSNNTFRFNMVQGPGGFFGLSDNSQPLPATVALYNNTFIQSGGDCVHANGSVVLNVSNNICFGNGINASINIDTATGFTLTGNDYFSTGGTFPHVSVDGGSTYMTSLAALQAAGFEKVGASNTGTIANPTFTGTPPAGVCGGYDGTCPSTYNLNVGSTLIKGSGLNLNSIYSFNVGTQDFYGNVIGPTTLPIGAAGNR
jgi:hypothetical protein